jgi:hypothetical protein
VGEDERSPAVGTATANISFRITKDRMHLFLSCDSDVLKLSGLFEQIAAQLVSRGIVFAPDRASFDQMRAEALETAAEQVTDFLLVSGEVLVEPQDGRLEWSRDYFDTHYPVNPKTGEIDFKNRVGNPSVLGGDLVVKVIRAKPGRPGKDLDGTFFPVRPPVELRFIPASNVKWDEEAGGYRAVCAGRVSFREHTLRIDPVLHVRGSVSTETGNIRHNGSVVIQGDVDPGYTVQATDDIEIRGMVYAAHIKCGGNLAIAGGVNGNSCASLETGGSLHAKFILNSTVRSRGEVVVEKEIYRSNVESGGEVRIASGRIVGGETVAARGITVGEAGSGSDPRTILAIRPDREIMAGIQKLKKRVADAGEQLLASRQALRNYKKQELLLSAAGKRKMAEIAAEAARLEEWIAARAGEIQKIVRKLEEDQWAVIRVQNRFHPGVCFRIYHGDLLAETEMLGPVVAGLDWATGTVVLQSADDPGGNDMVGKDLG